MLRLLLLASLGLAATGCTSSRLGDLSSAYGAREPARARVSEPLLAAMGGGLVGGTLAQQLDERDRRTALEAEYRALEYTPSGQPVTWRNPRKNRSGEVIAAQPYRVGSQDCRQYSHTVFVDGRPTTTRGAACRNENGSWTPLT